MAMTHTLDTVEGFIGGTISYHYDVGNDVLYLRKVEHLNTPTFGEENDEGLIEDRDETTDALVGLTVVSWWKRFGTGELPDSLADIARAVEPMAAKIGG